LSCLPCAGPQVSGHRPFPPSPRLSCMSAVYSWLVVAWPARAVIRSSLSRPCSIRTAAAVERVQRRRARMSSRRASTLGVRFTEIFSVLVSSMCGTLPQSAEAGPLAAVRWPGSAHQRPGRYHPRASMLGQQNECRRHASGKCHAPAVWRMPGLRALYARNERRCGQLVLAFLGLHELCGKAVRITCVRGRSFLMRTPT